MSGTTDIESSVAGNQFDVLPLSSSSWIRTRTKGSKDPCAAVTPRRNVRERIGHVCPTAFRHADPTRFADWIPKALSRGLSLQIGKRMVRESNSPGTFAPTVLAGLRLCRTAHHPCQCFSAGHTGQASMDPSWERFPCGVRGVGRIRTSGGLCPCCFRDSRIRPLCHYSTDPHEGTNWLTFSCGSRAPGGIRTHDRKVRTLLLWSAELREQGGCLLRFKKSDNPFPKE